MIILARFRVLLLIFKIYLSLKLLGKSIIIYAIELLIFTQNLSQFVLVLGLYGYVGVSGITNMNANRFIYPGSCCHVVLFVFEVGGYDHFAFGFSVNGLECPTLSRFVCVLEVLNSLIINLHINSAFLSIFGAIKLCNKLICYRLNRKFFLF